MIMEAPGSRSEGLRMRVLPVARATGMVQRGIMLRLCKRRPNIQSVAATYAGKLKGAMLPVCELTSTLRRVHDIPSAYTQRKTTRGSVHIFGYCEDIVG